MVRILSIGAAVQDVFLLGAIFNPKTEDGEQVEQFSLGSKNEIDGVVFATGGGATNAAVTFARHEFHSAFMGAVGHDQAGNAVIDALHDDQVDTSLVSYSSQFGTGYSCLLLAPNGERTILTYRGASTHDVFEEKDFHDQEADWLYLSSLEGNFQSLEIIFNYAVVHNMKIAMNPGKKELASPDKLKTLLPKLSVLSLNKDEISVLFEGNSMEDLVRAASATVHNVIVTDGPQGMVATDGKKIVSGGLYEDVKVIDRTGAGDAFSSGFVASIASGEGIEKAVVFASANATSVVTKIGAKAGILPKREQLHGMNLEVKEL